MSTYIGTRTDGLADIDSVLVQEANRIGADIHQENVHTSPWLDLIPKGTFPEGAGYRLQSLIYERALPTNAAQTAIGLGWGDFAGPTAMTSGQDHSASVTGTGGLLNDSVSDYHGPLANDAQGGAASTNPARIDFHKRLEPYSLQRATVWSPEINVEDLRFAAHRADQLSAAFEALAEGVRFGWEERYRDEYQRVCGYVVECMETDTDITTTGSQITDASATDRFQGGQIPSLGAGRLAATVLGNISHDVLDKIRNAMIRQGAGKNPWGRENGQPIFGLVCSSEASFTLQSESNFRTDFQESSRVDELLQPLGVSKSLRGWYHIIDDLCPRYKNTGNDYDRVDPYTLSAGLVVPNSEYETATATYEVAHVLHKDTMQALIPNPISGQGMAKFDPVDYSGKFHWLNIKSVDLNPLGTIGHFLGVLASATKPLKTKFGYAIIFDRLSTTASSVTPAP